MKDFISMIYPYAELFNSAVMPYAKKIILVMSGLTVIFLAYFVYKTRKNGNVKTLFKLMIFVWIILLVFIGVTFFVSELNGNTMLGSDM